MLSTTLNPLQYPIPPPSLRLTEHKTNTARPLTDPYFVTVDMSKNWNWSDDKTFLANQIHALDRPETTGSSDNPLAPPSLIRGALFRGPSSDPNLYLYGGSVYTGNLSSPYYEAPDSRPGLLWSYNPAKQSWKSLDISGTTPVRPNHGAWVDAPNLGIGFWLNGQTDYGSAANIGIAPNQTRKVDGMAVVQLNGTDAGGGSVRQAWNVSNGNLGGPRVGGGFTYVQNIGTKGAVVALGGLVGETQKDTSISGDYQRLYGPDGGAFVSFWFPCSFTFPDFLFGVDWWFFLEFVETARSQA